MDRRNCKSYILFSYIYFCIFLLFSLSACTRSETIKIGFISDLSSRNSELGLQGRNGLIMAINEINDKGGIRGKQFEYIIGNHKGDKELCAEVVRELIDQGVNIIIGPLVSEMASTVIDAAEESGLVIIGPTVSTDELTGIDDNFLRMVTPASVQGKYLAKYLNFMNKKKVALVLDKKNNAYTSSVSLGFRNELKDQNISIADDLYFEGKDDFPHIVELLETINPDSIVFASNGIDTAGIVQHYSKNNSIPQLFGSFWVKVTNVIVYGGKTVDGMIIIDSYETSVPVQREVKFIEDYRDLYGIEPNISAKTCYEAVSVFARAYLESGSLKNQDIKKTMLNLKLIEGLSDVYSFDQFGDAIRKVSYFKVEDNQYKLISDPQDE